MFQVIGRNSWCINHLYYFPLLGVLFLVSISTYAQTFTDPCVKASYNKAMESFGRKNYKDAIKWLNIAKGCPLASEEDPRRIDAKITECRSFLKKKIKIQPSLYNSPMETIPMIELVYLEGGTFQMGSNDGENDEKPVHTVTVNSFYIGKYEVTQNQWCAVMGENSRRNIDCSDCPVECVYWDSIQEFIRELNQKTGKKFRLPTEAEWEFAARGGNMSGGYPYSGSNSLKEVAWYWDNSELIIHPVGQKSPNEIGLYDMSGNVWEFCSDLYLQNYYTSSPSNNPENKKYGSEHVARGGGASGYNGYCRVSSRCYWITDGGYWIGFRLLMEE